MFTRLSKASRAAGRLPPARAARALVLTSIAALGSEPLIFIHFLPYYYSSAGVTYPLGTQGKKQALAALTPRGGRRRAARLAGQLQRFPGSSGKPDSLAILGAAATIF